MSVFLCWYVYALNGLEVSKYLSVTKININQDESLVEPIKLLFFGDIMLD